MTTAMTFEYAIVGVVAYLIGSIPCGVLLGKTVFKGDPRTGGSGSIGATNMNRMFGFKAFAATFALDAAKGAIAVIFARIVAGLMPFAAEWELDLLIVLAIMFSVLGHVFSPWLGFKGGKGISTGFGSILAGYPFVALCLLVTFLVFAGLTRRISVGSIAAAVGFPVFSCLFYSQNIPLLVVSIIVAVAVVFAHRGNLVRIFHGTEPKFSFKKDDAKDAAETSHTGDAR